MAPCLPTLQTPTGTLQGILDDRFGSPVYHFRGIPYGRISKRFAKPELSKLSGDVNATRFG